MKSRGELNRALSKQADINLGRGTTFLFAEKHSAAGHQSIGHHGFIIRPRNHSVNDEGSPPVSSPVLDWYRQCPFLFDTGNETKNHSSHG